MGKLSYLSETQHIEGLEWRKARLPYKTNHHIKDLAMLNSFDKLQEEGQSNEELQMQSNKVSPNEDHSITKSEEAVTKPMQGHDSRVVLKYNITSSRETITKSNKAKKEWVVQSKEITIAFVRFEHTVVVLTVIEALQNKGKSSLE